VEWEGKVAQEPNQHLNVRKKRCLKNTKKPGRNKGAGTKEKRGGRVDGGGGGLEFYGLLPTKQTEVRSGAGRKRDSKQHRKLWGKGNQRPEGLHFAAALD